MASYGCEGFLGNFEGDVRDGFYMCNAGVTVGSVLADGSFSACPSIRADYNQGNLYAGDDFMEIWNSRYAVFRDSSFNGSPAKINVGEIFKMLAPDTRVKVI